MNKPIKRRNATISKNLILTNAIKLFSKKGYSSASMDELASMCDLNKAMIFYYYKSKQGLYEAVIVKVLDEIYSTVVKANKNYDKPMDELECFIKTYASFACKFPHLPSLLLKELSDSGAMIAEQLFGNMKKMFMLFSDILKRGEERGCFKDVVPMILYFMILGSLNLMITTKKQRIKAYETEGIDTCSTCDIDEISDYIVKKIKKMLKD
jgi:AcrR family transcriptional regulator